MEEGRMEEGLRIGRGMAKEWRDGGGEMKEGGRVGEEGGNGGDIENGEEGGD